MFFMNLMRVFQAQDPTNLLIDVSIEKEMGLGSLDDLSPKGRPLHPALIINITEISLLG